MSNQRWKRPQIPDPETLFSFLPDDGGYDRLPRCCRCLRPFAECKCPAPAKAGLPAASQSQNGSERVQSIKVG